MKKRNDTRVKLSLSEQRFQRLKEQGVASRIRAASDFEINLVSPTKFFEDINKPTQSRLYEFMEKVKTSSEEMLDTTGRSFVIEFNNDMQWRWRKVTTTSELKKMMENEKKAYDKYMKIKESQMNKMVRASESFGGSGYNGDGDSAGGLQVRDEYTPLIGTPFFKQLYLYDYWAMHSKCFWYKNYSGIAKLIIDMTRNFVMGKGFKVDFEDTKAQAAWDRYEELSNIQEESRNWCDELTAFGENMLKKVPVRGGGIIHRSFDPSTIWEIVTDPENINDIKYYHQQYNTQYQLYGDTKSKTPLSKYVINQLPPSLVLHTKVNVTSYEKRGRSDLLAALLYFKYYEDYTQAKLARAKNEAAFIWDVEVDGSQEDVDLYISTTQDIADVPPGSENVHNKAVKRTPLSPQFGKAGTDSIAQDILSYVAMSTTIPATYMGTFGTSGNTKAGALVATEPVAKKMVERQLKMEHLIRRCVKDVLIANKMDPNTSFEVTFPEIMEEDRSTKIQDLILIKDEKVISHETMSKIAAKELKINKYDYDAEQSAIIKESKKNQMFSDSKDDGSSADDKNSDLTQDDDGPENDGKRKVNRADIKKDGLKF